MVAAVKEDPGRGRTRRRQIGTSRRMSCGAGNGLPRHGRTLLLHRIAQAINGVFVCRARHTSPNLRARHRSLARAAGSGQQSGPGPFWSRRAAKTGDSSQAFVCLTLHFGGHADGAHRSHDLRDTHRVHPAAGVQSQTDCPIKETGVFLCQGMASQTSSSG